LNLNPAVAESGPVRIRIQTKIFNKQNNYWNFFDQNMKFIHFFVSLETILACLDSDPDFQSGC
jgi:hypothetical protein